VISSPYADLDRPPLSATALRSALVRDGGLWRELRVVAETGSTSADAAAAARSGAAEGLVIVAEHQSAGRGRLDRSWQSPPRAGLTMSVLLRPAVPRERWGLLTLVVAVAAARAVRERTGVAVEVKWPNDLVVSDRKLAGVLAEVVGDAVVVGLGLNVSTRPAELPPGATSLAVETGEAVNRQPVLLALLREVGVAYDKWESTGGPAEPMLRSYRQLSATLGRTVRATLTGGETLTGRAVAVDGTGRLVVTPEGGPSRTLSTGDVVHLRESGLGPDR
ncbi:MAG: biotin--[acetyl-CoA-carboxylase] ligase, partial [Mycobacteriales bacterium]